MSSWVKKPLPMTKGRRTGKLTKASLVAAERREVQEIRDHHARLKQECLRRMERRAS